MNAASRFEVLGAVVVGCLVGQWLLVPAAELAVRRDADRRAAKIRQAMSAASAPRSPDSSAARPEPSVATTSIGAPSADDSRTLTSPRERADPAVPRSHAGATWRASSLGTWVRHGQAGEPYLHQASWRVSPVVAAANSQWAAPRFVERARAVHEHQLRREASLGPPPWRNERFVAMLTTRAGFSVVGREFAIPASVEDTAKFYVEAAGTALDDGIALRLLRRYEVSERQARSSVEERVRELAEAGTYRRESLAVLARGGDLWLLSPDDCSELQALMSEDEARAAALSQRVVELLR